MPHFFNPKETKGFTLLEVLFSAVLLSVIGVAIYNVLLMGQKTFDAGLGLLELQSQLRIAISCINRELHEAKSMTITMINANDDSILFTTPNEVAIQYYRDINDLNHDGKTDQIIREYPTGTRIVVANHVSALHFSSSGKLVTTTLTGTNISGGRQYQLALSVKTGARNE